jgi:hypothetical protein
MDHEETSFGDGPSLVDIGARDYETMRDFGNGAKIAFDMHPLVTKIGQASIHSAEIILSYLTRTKDGYCAQRTVTSFTEECMLCTHFGSSTQ